MGGDAWELDELEVGLPSIDSCHSAAWSHQSVICLLPWTALLAFTLQQLQCCHPQCIHHTTCLLPQRKPIPMAQECPHDHRSSVIDAICFGGRQS